LTEVCFQENAIEQLAASWPSLVGGAAGDRPAATGPSAAAARSAGAGPSAVARPPALVVMDVNTREAAGRRVVAELKKAGVHTRSLEFAEESGLRATPLRAKFVRRWLHDEVDSVPVAVGSGVITDIVRYAAHLSDRDFVSVPTAASMDGYASSVAALEHQGVKVTYPARAPRAIFAEPAVLSAAPPELTRAGLGDLLGKATAHMDWLTAHLLYGESYDRRVAGMVQGPLEFAARQSENVLRGDPQAVGGLFTGLIRSGEAMALLGSSRPASGCEHHASHFWDLLAGRGLRPHTSHGLQVGYATGFAMRIQRFAIEHALPTLHAPVAVSDPLGPEAREWLGAPTEEIRSAVREKRRFAADLTYWPQDAATSQAVAEGLREGTSIFGEVQSALTLAGIPTRPGFLGIDEHTLRATFRYATRLRARYTVIDLLEGQGMLEQAIEAALSTCTAPTSGHSLWM
jgi:glycerol-1-phosphate dehydrogenase [NAD(P)+]